MTREPKYYRLRIEAIKSMLPDADEQTKRWLQNGFVPDEMKSKFEKQVTEERLKHRFATNDDLNEPLTLTELTTFSTWFDMHPEKVAGTMQGGTSLYFPVIVKGTKADVEKMFANTLAATPAPQQPTAAELSEDEEMEMLELEAEALKLKLKLLDDEPKFKVGDIVYVTRYTTPRLALIVKDYGRYVDAIDITAQGDGGYIIRIQNKHFGIRNEQLSPVDKALQAKIRQSIGEDEIDYFIQQSNSNN